MPIGGTTELCEAEKFYDEDLYNTVVGYADYRKNYFDFEVEYDNINFFDGELPTLRFEKMTKEEFRETYGEERYNRITERKDNSI